MLASYQAVLDHGQVIWLDTPPDLTHAKIIVTVLPNNISPDMDKDTYYLSKVGECRLGFMRDEINVPDDINWGDDEVAKLFGID